MDEEKVGLILARASELRLKITNCIHKASILDAQEETKNQEFEEEDEETAETLLNIKDALEALEAQLSSLQALQQQQWYEKEAALADIECSQKNLLKKLEEYEGKDLDVIHEAIVFAGETVDDNNDLLLPPYPSRPSPPLRSDSGYNFMGTHKYSGNGLISNGQKEEFSKGLTSTDKNQMAPESKSPFRGIKMLLSAAAKATFTVVGVICILSLAGFEPRLRKRDHNQLNIWGLLPQLEENNEKKGTTMECPAGMIHVIEDGEVRCLVKERVEVPFGSVVATPDVNYCCG